MNHHNSLVRQQTAAKETTPSRCDRISATLVKKAITLQQIHGTAYAVEFLKEKDIDIEIATRVLLGDATKRRHDDPVDHVVFDQSFDATLDANPGWCAIDSFKPT